VAEIEPESTGKVIDLMEALRASLERTESAKDSPPSSVRARKAKRVEQPAKTARKASRR
jgi:non-homologous end joining protein Ku